MGRFQVLVSVISLLALTCASAPEPDVADADARMVEQCKFVGHVSGGSVIGGVLQRTARSHARDVAKRDAAKLGATHIVWSNVHSGYFEGASADGDAYRCPK
jgi:hypothetical protein